MQWPLTHCLPSLQQRAQLSVVLQLAQRVEVAQPLAVDVQLREEAGSARRKHVFSARRLQRQVHLHCE